MAPVEGGAALAVEAAADAGGLAGKLLLVELVVEIALLVAVVVTATVVDTDSMFVAADMSETLVVAETLALFLARRPPRTRPRPAFTFPLQWYIAVAVVVITVWIRQVR